MVCMLTIRPIAASAKTSEQLSGKGGGRTRPVQIPHECSRSDIRQGEESSSKDIIWSPSTPRSASSPNEIGYPFISSYNLDLELAEPGATFCSLVLYPHNITSAVPP
jgi:hypothetical protein